MVRMSVPWLFPGSMHVTVSTLAPMVSATLGINHAPVALVFAVPDPPRLFTHRQMAMPDVSVDVPAMLLTAEAVPASYVVLEVGDEMVTDGAVLSRLGSLAFPKTCSNRSRIRLRNTEHSHRRAQIAHRDAELDLVLDRHWR
jgi:hypothetical protein